MILSGFNSKGLEYKNRTYSKNGTLAFKIFIKDFSDERKKDKNLLLNYNYILMNPNKLRILYFNFNN